MIVQEQLQMMSMEPVPGHIYLTCVGGWLVNEKSSWIEPRDFERAGDRRRNGVRERAKDAGKERGKKRS